MKTYGKHVPTFYDRHLNIDDDEERREHWLVLPCSRTRDSYALEESNFHCAAAAFSINADSAQCIGDGAELHRFGHWACGWYEIIIVDPDNADALRRAREIESALEEYPILDENDYSERQFTGLCELWEALTDEERAEFDNDSDRVGNLPSVFYERYCDEV